MINDSSGYSDYEELEIAHDRQNVDETKNTISLNEALPNELKSKAFRKKIECSKSSKSAIAPFFFFFYIELKRSKSIGLSYLFTAWLEFCYQY
jgi:hypothetical protein